MNSNYTPSSIAARIWLLTSAVFGCGWVVFALFSGGVGFSFVGIIAGIVAAVGSLPVLVCLYFLLPVIKESSSKNKLLQLVILCFAFASIYGLVGSTITSSFGSSNFIESLFWFILILFGSSLIAILLLNKSIDSYFFTEPAILPNESWQQDSETQINTNMETTNQQFANFENRPMPTPQSNKVVIKAIIIAVLTLAMLIPTTIISNMIIERQTNNTPKATVAASATNETTVAPTILSRNYEKTMRTTKYAILVIGLTFAVFFLIEIMHKKPVHPMQYTLVGLALAIFYTLLLSIGEYILFDYAYIISGTATIMLITMYVKSHFQNWKAASALGGVLTGLYGFILVLVSLEDTALIIGSIGLFIVLAVIMYTTRNINWYNPSMPKEREALT